MRSLRAPSCSEAEASRPGGQLVPVRHHAHGQLVGTQSCRLDLHCFLGLNTIAAASTYFTGKD